MYLLQQKQDSIKKIYHDEGFILDNYTLPTINFCNGNFIRDGEAIQIKFSCNALYISFSGTLLYFDSHFGLCTLISLCSIKITDDRKQGMVESVLTKK